MAFLSSFLSEQATRTRRELLVMQAHVQRVEKMAAVGEMAAGLAHEIKNPLASLTGAIQMLREDIRYDPDHDRLMQIILREADRLSSLVGNFLLYAKLPVGKSEPIDIERTLRETLELFGKKGTLNGPDHYGLAHAQPGIWVDMDPSHLRQVLWNLLINAAEAIEGPGQIRIELAGAKGRQASLKIIDSGVGMSPETLASIFDPFFTTKANGTGLGLSIVHRILETYDCRLDVGSTPGQGTTFSLHFHRLEAPAPARQLSLDRLCQFKISNNVNGLRRMWTRRTGRDGMISHPALSKPSGCRCGLSDERGAPLQGCKRCSCRFSSGFGFRPKGCDKPPSIPLVFCLLFRTTSR